MLFTAINWAFTTLFDGKGRVNEIWIAATYAVLPLIIINVIKLLLSNFLLQDEAVFLSLLTWIGYGWTGFLLLKGLEACHQYNMKKAASSVAVSVVGIFIVAFVFVLLLSLSQQIVSFIATVAQELSMRSV